MYVSSKYCTKILPSYLPLDFLPRFKSCQLPGSSFNTFSSSQQLILSDQHRIVRVNPVSSLGIQRLYFYIFFYFFNHLFLVCICFLHVMPVNNIYLQQLSCLCQLSNTLCNFPGYRRKIRFRLQIYRCLPFNVNSC